ncbi:MAG: protocatechuate 3,4-dioxygenase subunit alpha [Chloroflexi bacterium]|nr:protocatechuate 3,4-dioxygenase subunit alpha [Chloroflexota bacterium]
MSARPVTSVQTLTSAQTIGPFYGPALLRADAHFPVLAGPGVAGERVRIEGRVLDGDGAPVPDALIELWQANAHGRYNHPSDDRDLPLDPSFTGYGRTGAEEDGSYWFETIKPGRVPGPSGALQAPHVVVTLFARGLTNHVVTRLYFADDPANGEDPILARVPATRRGTLLAQPTERNGRRVYRFDVVLQGEDETVFFNL